MASPAPRLAKSRRHTRSFSILDGMILIAATGIGLVLGKLMFAKAFPSLSNPVNAARPVSYFLLACTFGFIVIRLRRPRPPLHRIMGQPGMAACCAVVVVTAIDATSWARYWMQLEPRFATEMLIRYWRLHSHHLGPAVAATWLGLLLSRRWRPEHSWVDRWGRLIGVLWLLTIFCEWRYGRWTLNFTYRWWKGS